MDSKLTKLLDLLADSESNYQLLNEQLEYLAESDKNIIVIIQDLTNTY